MAGSRAAAAAAAAAATAALLAANPLPRAWCKRRFGPLLQWQVGTSRVAVPRGVQFAIVQYRFKVGAWSQYRFKVGAQLQYRSGGGDVVAVPLQGGWVGAWLQHHSKIGT